MSHYLSNIASRSIGNDSYTLLPSTPVFTAFDPGIVRDFGDENNVQDNTGQNQFVQQNFVSVRPTPLQNVQQPENISRTENSVQEKNIVHSYFSKHIDRVNVEQKERLEIIQPHETGSFKIEEPSQEIAVKGSSEKSNGNETIFVDKIISNIIPGNQGREKQTDEIVDSKHIETVQDDEIISVKKQIINPRETGLVDERISIKKQINNPLNEDKGHKINKLLPSKSSIEHITPNQPRMENNRPVQNQIQQSTSKLVIGKITVEILPPKLPVPQKIITRVVQSSSKDSHSKSNKLTFGLGQM